MQGYKCESIVSEIQKQLIDGEITDVRVVMIYLALLEDKQINEEEVIKLVVVTFWGSKLRAIESFQKLRKIVDNLIINNMLNKLRGDTDGQFFYRY